MALSDSWQRFSPREQRMVALAGAVVAGAIAWIAVWRPIDADIARLARDVPRAEELAAQARAQADDIAALGRAAPAARAQDPLPAVERALAERGLRAAVTSLDVQDGRVRLTLAMVRFDALPPLLDALARTAGLVPVDVTLQPRVEPGLVRAELVLGTSK